MPISEFQQTGKPMMVADLPYAHETVGDYGAVCFFHPDRPEELANFMQQALLGRLKFPRAEASLIAAPFARDWEGLFEILILAAL